MNYKLDRIDSMLSNRDCNFMFCLPLDQQAFNADATNPAKHFVREHLPANRPDDHKSGQLWEAYHREVVMPYLKFRKQFSQFGFVFHENVTLGQFADLIHAHKVNIVFSHCKAGDIETESVEFFDQLTGIASFIEAIPFEYDKTIDLSVCMPVNLAQELKTRRRNCVVKSSSKAIGFIYWLYFYSIVFEIIHTQKIDYYSTALEKAIFKLYEK